VLKSVFFFQTEGITLFFVFAAVLLIDLGGILANTGWVARGVLALLLLFSIISWAMIFQKVGMFGRVRRQSDQFRASFAPRAASSIRKLSPPQARHLLPSTPPASENCRARSVANPPIRIRQN